MSRPIATAEVAEILRRLRLFAALSDDELHELASRALRREYGLGQVLFLEGEACEGMYLIARGVARVFKTSPAGREVLLTMERAPASIAEIPVFDGGPYPASAAAVSEVTAFIIPRREFEALCRRHPDVALKLLAVVGNRLRGLVATLHQVVFGSVRQRLAHTLLEMADRAGGDSFDLPETREDLAVRLGTVREVLSRNLSRFQSQGLVSVEGRRVRIDDPEGLRQEASLELH